MRRKEEMKKIISLFCLSSMIALLASCGGGNVSSSTSPSIPSSVVDPVDSSSSSSSSSSKADIVVPDKPEVDEEIESAILGLRKNHHVDVTSKAEVRYPNSKPSDDSTYYIVDVYYYTTVSRDYQFADGTIEAAITEQTSTQHGDLDKTTGLPSSSSNYSKTSSKVTYWEDTDGSFYREDLSVQNVLDKVTMVSESSDGIYTPLTFDNTFRNPWDFIGVDDITIDSDGVWHLDKAKGRFVLDCYSSISGNFLTDVVIERDDNGNVSGLQFTTDDLASGDSTSENYFVRKNSYEVKYSNIDNISITHLEPFTESNEELKKAFNKVKEVIDDTHSFTYRKTFSSNPSATVGYTTGFFSKDLVFYHNLSDAFVETPYKNGDNYDYRAYYDVSAKNYNVQQYSSDDGITWNWGDIAISTTTNYTIDTWEEIGPSFYSELSDLIFEPVTDDSGNVVSGQYSIREELLPSIGTYFDNGLLGVNTDLFDGGTSSCIVDISHFNSDDGSGRIYIYTTYNDGQGDTPVTFTLSDLGTTEIPAIGYENSPYTKA